MNILSELLWQLETLKDVEIIEIYLFAGAQSYCFQLEDLDHTKFPPDITMIRTRIMERPDIVLHNSETCYRTWIGMGCKGANWLESKFY